MQNLFFFIPGSNLVVHAIKSMTDPASGGCDEVYIMKNIFKKYFFGVKICQSLCWMLICWMLMFCHLQVHSLSIFSDRMGCYNVFTNFTPFHVVFEENAYWSVSLELTSENSQISWRPPYKKVLTQVSLILVISLQSFVTC